MSKVIRDFKNSRGKRQVTIELEEGEEINVAGKNDTILVVSSGEFYRLGGQVDDVVGAHVLHETELVQWCSVSQKWVS